MSLLDTGVMVDGIRIDYGPRPPNHGAVRAVVPLGRAPGRGRRTIPRRAGVELVDGYAPARSRRRCGPGESSRWWRSAGKGDGWCATGGQGSGGSVSTFHRRIQRAQ